MYSADGTQSSPVNTPAHPTCPRPSIKAMMAAENPVVLIIAVSPLLRCAQSISSYLIVRPPLGPFVPLSFLPFPRQYRVLKV